MANFNSAPAFTTSDQQDTDITQGLLPVLQTAVALRFLLLVLGSGLGAIVMYVVFGGERGDFQPPASVRWLSALFLLEPTLLAGYVFWPRVRRMLGHIFLPIALGWLLLVPVAQHAAGMAAFASDLVGRQGEIAFGGVGFESVWMAIPVALAALQYGRRGWLWTVSALAVAQISLVLLVIGDNGVLGPFLLISVARVVMIALLGWVVLRLVEALRAEHAALVEANHQLAQRAATIEQLAESRERNRLARELHDTLAHSLTGVSVQLQALGTLLKHDPAAASAQLQDTQTTVREGIQESRRAIESLRATPLEDLGLSEALRALCRRQAERSGIPFTCEIDDVAALDPLTEQAIYRVAEAALANVAQHAVASEVVVRLSDRPRLQLEISDNGIGFDPDSIPADRYGLSGMAERTQLVGAELEVESEVGMGTRVRLGVGMNQ